MTKLGISSGKDNTELGSSVSTTVDDAMLISTDVSLDIQLECISVKTSLQPTSDDLRC